MFYIRRPSGSGQVKSCDVITRNQVRSHAVVVSRGQVPARAEYNFLDRVRWLDMYGVVLHPVKV